MFSKIEGSQATARVTAELLQSVISQHREPSTNAAAALIEAVRSVGELLIDANPVGMFFRTIVLSYLIEGASVSSNIQLDGIAELAVGNTLKSVLRISLTEKITETCLSAIPVMRLSHPPSLCAILDGLSKSATLCQTSALGDGVEGKGKLYQVIVGVHAVMANGGVVAPVWVEHGCRKSMLFHLLWLLVYMRYVGRKSIPSILVLKLCSLNPHNPEVVLNEPRSPSGLLQFEEFSDCMDYGIGSGLHVVNPSFDYVSLELVTLFVTDVGGYKSSYIYRLIADYYPADDFTG
ncbi:hypothetical protein Patl1_25649 [Pistacia atlantica]|uniref:Uncharacterized protein n=1 Tax=Pistacia atlantica TaxID=434234 RepID=A0ACC1B2P0_9ROSI|nr:hypothetical protein Patl1_25649 [Pistacia atlantica]